MSSDKKLGSEGSLSSLPTRGIRDSPVSDMLWVY